LGPATSRIVASENEDVLEDPVLLVPNQKQNTVLPVKRKGNQSQK